MKPVLFIALFAILILAIPIPTNVCHSLTIKVLDSSGKPASGIAVTQEWAYYSLSDSEHRDSRTSDEKGAMIFPERMVWRTLAWRLFRSVTGVIDMHRSHSASVVILSEGNLFDRKEYRGDSVPLIINQGGDILITIIK